MNRKRDFIDLTQVKANRERLILREIRYQRVWFLGEWVCALFLASGVVGFFYYAWLN
jgi:hypothetical protein